ncbi:T9SS type A sorting domain-containing protein [Flavobacterium sedimenticola]|uniref:T9SS type A sorting domain-containing protein n=1 Tax=Flavobacterium sedimenticola TaxID=3043286 RepID=A0ABT6XS13_9FLAO|nr:T9SS type A sorting domain-containing protein [Flavobacterium sedimenticola]MDI9257879.1 T9SS type A sorting domain-containing protein [Flavobacterium sedimenticola]
MKTKILFLTLMVYCIGNAQNFQKGYGVINVSEIADQQELYSLNIANNNIFTAGVYKAASLFSLPGFYGTLSRLKLDGDLIWYKAYAPQNSDSLVNIFISSVTNVDNSIYCLSYYLGEGETSGYLLMKLDESGNVIFTKKIKDVFPDMASSKLVYHNHFIYCLTNSRILKFSTEGELIKSVSLNATILDLFITSTNKLALTGNTFIGPNYYIPLILLDEDLNLDKGYLYYSLESEFSQLPYGKTIAEGANNKLILGGPGSYMAFAEDGQPIWARSYLPLVNNTPQYNSMDSLLEFADIESFNNGNGLLGVVKSFYAISPPGVFEPQEDDYEYWHNYTSIVDINLNDGTANSIKTIKHGFDTYRDNIVGNEIKLVENNYYFAGKYIDFDFTKKVNYVHKGTLDDIGCGEVEKQFPSFSFLENIGVAIFPEDGVFETFEIITDVEMQSYDINPNFNSIFCANTLSTPENNTIEINIYPNPSKHSITIDGLDITYKVTVYDTMGKLIKTYPIAINNTYDISNLQMGLYIVKIETEDNNVYFSKLIKN